MTPSPKLLYTDVRTRLVNGRPLIGVRHTARAAADLPVTTPWVEMTPEDAARLVTTLQATLAELGPPAERR